MELELKLNHPWMVAVWPGIGHVAINAGFYLLAKLDMRLFAEFSPRELFDFEHVEVKEGIVRTAGLPRSRFFLWTDPTKRRDLIVFIGEAQPTHGKYAFCYKLIEYAKSLGVEQVLTFAAMATNMRPRNNSRVFGVATQESLLSDLKEVDVQLLADGHIGGLNGLLIGAAGELEMKGACILGEMPHVLAALPYPKASLSVLETFTTYSGIDVDLDELAKQTKAFDDQLGMFLAREQGPKSEIETETEESEQYSIGTDETSPEERDHIEELFGAAQRDKANAYELKRELDRLGLFKEYEERFLDLFKRAAEDQ